MQAVIFGLFMPVIPLLIWRRYHREAQLTAAEIISRYAVYTLLTTVLTTLAMTVLCDENTSFLEKMDRSPSFMLKYALISAAAVALISAVEWMYHTRRITVTVEWEQYKNWGLARFIRKFLFPSGLFLLAALTVILNFMLIFDNVLWGDEAYAGNLVHHSVKAIFQVLTLEENHPPLYYLWLKMFAELFGYSGPVYHFSSFVPFLIGIFMAVTVFRKRFGAMPAAIFVLVSGLSAPCLEYNMEIRMYALAFLGIVGSFYCAYRILDGGKTAAWIGIVFWGLVAAYSHYYALVAAGILLALTFNAAAIRFRGKTWIKGAVALLVFIAAYLPWLSQLFRATKSVSGNWWMTEIDTPRQIVAMITCGESMSKIILPLFLLLLIVILIGESGIFHVQKVLPDKLAVQVTAPSIRQWSAEAYTLAVGALTIAGTLVFAYGLSAFVQPLLTTRYLYPLCAITAIILVIGMKRLFSVLQLLEERLHKGWLLAAGKVVLFLILAALFVEGLGDYRAYRTVVENESAKTEETLYIIGEPVGEMELVNNGIMHIGWTVLHYYYPDAEIVNGNYDRAETNDFWYFTPDYLDEEEMKDLTQQGYEIAAYGERQISKYTFVLYHITKGEVPEPAVMANGEAIEK